MSISIHALLAESDLRETVPSGRHVIFLSTLSLRRATRASPRLKERIKDFYPRSPCGERHLIDDNSLASGIFLSTLSLRRATQGNKFRQSRNSHFYPRSPCGERQISENRYKRTSYFYPRSPCGERQDTLSTPNRPKEFLSTLSLRRATWHIHGFLRGLPISIHALLAESDGLFLCL